MNKVTPYLSGNHSSLIRVMLHFMCALIIYLCFYHIRKCWIVYLHLFFCMNSLHEQVLCPFSVPAICFMLSPSWSCIFSGADNFCSFWIFLFNSIQLHTSSSGAYKIYVPILCDIYKICCKYMYMYVLEVVPVHVITYNMLIVFV